jgi:translocation and assembly module TamB
MRALKIFAISIGGLIGLLLIVFGALQTPPGQRMAANLISSAASGPEGGVELDGLTGFFPTNLGVARIALSDREGPWLTVENARLRWSFGSLLSGRLRVEELSAERVAVLRPPLPDQQTPPDKGGDSRLRLPVGIELEAFSIGDLHLAAALAQVDSHWRLAGNALLPADLAQGRLVLNGERLDGPAGRLAADVRFDAERRTVDGEVRLTEGQGGVVAVLLERPDIADLSMRLVARGDATAGNAELTVAAADAARANGKVTWQPKDGATGVSVQLDTAGPGLPKGNLADAVRAPMSLTAQATIDDKLATLSEARLVAGPHAIEMTARYDRSADRVEGTARLRSTETGALGPLVGGVAWRGLDVEAKVDLGALARQPQGTIAVTGRADDLSVAAVDSRLPPPGAVTLAGTVTLNDGKITITSLDLGSAVASVKGEGSYTPESSAGVAKATVTLPSLAPLSALAGRPLSGAATVDLSATSDRDGYKMTWRGTVSDPTAEGLPASLVTSQIGLSGTATLRQDQSWTLSDVRVASEGGTLDLGGRGRDGAGELDLTVDLPKLDFLQAELAGAAKLSGNVQFGGERTQVRVTASLNGLGRGQITSRTLTLSATGSLAASGAANGEVKANGDLAGQPLSLDGRFALDEAGGVTVPSLKGQWASVVLDVDDFAVTSGRTSGYARLRVARLDDASALAGTNLGGSLDAEITADGSAANDRVTARLQGSDLRAGTLAIGTLEFRGSVDEPMTTAAVDATLAANRIAGAADINRLNATVTGDRQALVVSLQVSGAQTTANLGAKVEPAGDDIVVGLTKFDGRYSGVPVALAGPTRVHIAGPRIAIEPTNLRVGGGRVAVRGTLAPTGSDLQVEVAGMPLSLIDSFAPGTHLDGTLQTKLRVQGAMDAPLIDGTYGIAGLRVKRPEAALIPALTIQGSGSLMGRQASIDARLGSGGATTLTLKGKATLPRGAAPLAGSAAIAGTIDLAPFAPLLGNDIRNVTGRLRPDLTVEIAGSRVTGTGSIDFTNGAVSLPESGLRLSGGQGRFVLQSDVLQLQRLTFQTSRGGSVTAAGTIRLDAQQGVVPDLTVTSRNALLVSRPDLVASASSNLKITGSTAGGIDVAGPITIDRAEILVGAQQSAAYPTLEVREINKPGAPDTAQVAAKAPPRRAAPPPGATPVRLRLEISAPQAVFVRGRGLDAEMSGKVEVAGAPAAPTVTGGMTLRRGEFNLLGRRLTFSRGVVTLDNLDSIDPRLDFVASTTVQSTTINVNIGGTSREPTVAITSIPSLPPDEAMAMLLFGKPSSGLSIFELAQAAQGLAELTGNPSGAGALTRLRTGLGLDRLSVNSGNSANSPVSLEAGRYVAPGVYVGARQGATGNSSRGVVQVDVLENVKIEGDVGADSNQRIGVKMEWDY